MKRILVVEDSMTQAARLRLLLSENGYRVDVASTGEAGLRSIETLRPDLVISDVVMPGMDGFELCRAVKTSELAPRVPVILLTSRTSASDIITGLDAGADNFIPKPYDDDYLLERVRRIFEHLQLREKNTLDMEVVLTVGDRKISVTADRQQIIELLFSTFEQMSKSFDELAHANEELREARVAAERANNAKSRFLSRMSHELRTPLTSIIGFAQILEMSDIADRDRQCARTIERAGEHLLELINDLLDIGRIEADEMILSTEPVAVAGIHEEILNLVTPTAAQRQVEVHDKPPPAHLYAVADPLRLRQVLLNLVTNGIKYNRPGGSVDLDWEQSGDRLLIKIADTGVGIAQENIKRLFAPFDRIEAERRGDIEGTGLGLAVSKRLVELMGGRLTVESEVDVGTTFTVDIPLAEVAASLAQRGTTLRRPHRSRSTTDEATVVYITEQTSSFQLVERILQQRCGITPLHAAGGAEGLALVAQVEPGVILMDADLSDQPATHVIDMLRSDSATRTIPLIVLSTDAGQASQFRHAGASDYLPKPLDIDQFAETVASWCPMAAPGDGTSADTPEQRQSQ